MGDFNCQMFYYFIFREDIIILDRIITTYNNCKLR